MNDLEIFYRLVLALCDLLIAYSMDISIDSIYKNKLFFETRCVIVLSNNNRECDNVGNTFQSPTIKSYLKTKKT